MEQILVIDQGTHASRSMLYSETGKLLAISRHPVSIYRQSNQIIEQNAEEILASIYYCLDSLQQEHNLTQVRAAALVTQRSTIVGWHKQTGRLLSPAISWQDTRASDRINALQSQSEEICAITGLPLSPHYGASKMQWLIQHDARCQQAFKEENLVIAPLASYLVEQLTGNVEPVIDHVNAQRSQLLDLASLDWSPSMLNRFDLQAHCLPQLRPCLSDYGRFRHHDMPLKLLTGDQNAAVFAHGNPDKDTLMINIGTGAFVLKLTEQRGDNPQLLDGIAVSSAQRVQFLQEGTVNGAGAALAQLFNLIEEHDLLASLPGWLETIESPPIFINTVSGLGSPWWNNRIEPHYLDANELQLALNDKAVAIIESIVFLLQANIRELQNNETSKIIISGGLAQLDGLCQKLADLSQLEVRRTINTEASARGAAWLLCDQSKWQFNDDFTVFQPQQNPALNHRYQQFCRGLAAELKQTTDIDVSSAVN